MAEVYGCPEQAPVLAELIKNMYKCFIERDLLELTINPLVLTTEREILPMSLSIEIDETAAYRQAELYAMRDLSQMTHMERLTALADFDSKHYVRMDGNIGVVTNSAGLGMASCDMIENLGGKPANFLDLSGSGSHEQIIEMLHLLNQTNNVKVIFVNIFGSMFGS